VAIQNGICSRQDAKNRQVRKFNFFAAFAPLREIFRVLVQLGRAKRWVVRKCFDKGYKRNY
jgi:hypothetical protein